jgi:hypothetical protein
MYAKRGDLDNARMMYNNAVALDPGDWPFAALARSRLSELDRLPQRFTTPRERGSEVRLADMTVFEGPAACTICHQGADAALPR